MCGGGATVGGSCGGSVAIFEVGALEATYGFRNACKVCREQFSRAFLVRSDLSEAMLESQGSYHCGRCAQPPTGSLAQTGFNRA